MSPIPSHSHIFAMRNTVSEAAHSKIIQLIAKELGVGPQQVAAAVALLDEGSTVPFIARYRKEATSKLDDTQLRNLDERLLYLRELQDRRAVVLASIEEQGKLTDELRAAVEGAATKQALEDIYLPYKPKRRTARADRARGRARAAGRRAARRSYARPRAGSREVRERQTGCRERRPGRQDRARRRARYSRRAFRRDGRAVGQTARPHLGTGRRHFQGHERQEDCRGRKIPGLLRLFGNDTHHPLASRARSMRLDAAPDAGVRSGDARTGSNAGAARAAAAKPRRNPPAAQKPGGAIALALGRAKLKK
jgi:hypothetical protein